MQNFLEKHTNKRNILILIIAFIVLELLFGLFMPSAKMIDIAGATGSSEIYEIIETYSAQDRHSFIIAAVTLDLMFPVIYFFLFAMLLYRFWNKAWLSIFPFFQMIFDFHENVGIITMLIKWPEHLIGFASATVIFSWMKWAFCAVTILLIIIGMIRSLMIKKRQN